VIVKLTKIYLLCCQSQRILNHLLSVVGIIAHTVVAVDIIRVSLRQAQPAYNLSVQVQLIIGVLLIEIAHASCRVGALRKEHTAKIFWITLPLIVRKISEENEDV